LNAVHEFLASCNETIGDTQHVSVAIKKRHMVRALQTTRPSLSVSDRRMLDHAYRPFMSTADHHDDKDGKQVASNELRKLRTALK
jgi:hypothetical protein